MQYTRLHPLNLLPCLAALLGLAALPANAEKADRDKPLFFTSDKGGEGSFDSGDGTLTGNVIISQGTLRLTADQVNWKLPADGFYRFIASSTSEKQVEFRQARDTPGEVMVGLADRIEYDTKGDTVRLVGHAVMRLLRGALVVNEASSDALVYDKRTETYRLETQPGTRSRIMKLPPSTGTNTGASAPATAASSVPLQPSTTIQPPGARKAP